MRHFRNPLAKDEIRTFILLPKPVGVRLLHDTRRPFRGNPLSLFPFSEIVFPFHSKLTECRCSLPRVDGQIAIARRTGGPGYSNTASSGCCYPEIALGIPSADALEPRRDFRTKARRLDKEITRTNVGHASSPNRAEIDSTPVGDRRQARRPLRFPKLASQKSWRVNPHIEQGGWLSPASIPLAGPRLSTTGPT